MEEDDVVFFTLGGLGLKYSSFVISITTNRAISMYFVDLQEMLAYHERWLEA